MTERNIDDQENQTYDAQVAELATDMSEDEDTLDEFNEINQNDEC